MRVASSVMWCSLMEGWCSWCVPGTSQGESGVGGCAEQDVSSLYSVEAGAGIVR